MPDHLSDNSKSLLKQLLSKKPALRPDFDQVTLYYQIVIHNWFKNVDYLAPQFDS